MGIVSQEDFSGGIFRGRRAPSNAVYDLIGLIDNEGQPFRRGGSALLSTSDAGSTLTGLFDGHLAAGPRTAFWSASAFGVLDDFNAPIALLGQPAPVVRGAVVGGVLFLPEVPGISGFVSIVAYAGSRKASQYAIGTITLTNGSATVTGAGTSWTANVDPGMILLKGSTVVGTVQKVDSNTQLTLSAPYDGTTGAGLAYGLWPVTGTGAIFPTSGTPAVVASAGYRLLVCIGYRAYFSAPLKPFEFAVDTDYHELPQAAAIIGAHGIGDTAFLFTTAGVWAVTHLYFDPLDDFGNVQQTLEQVSDLVLWGATGIALWEGSMLVPAVDDVYVMAANGQRRPIGEGIQPLYQSYVKAGYQPGMAAVHRGHYKLPILNGTTLVDTLICRLDRGSAWSRWTGHAAGGAYAQRVGDTTRSPKLLGINGQRVTDLTGCLDPTASNKLDADGNAPPFQLTTRDYDLGPAIRKHTATKLRLEYELVDAASDNPTLTAEVAKDAPESGATYTTLTGTAPETTDASSPKTWLGVNKKGERLRTRYTANNATADCRIKRQEIHTREAGR